MLERGYNEWEEDLRNREKALGDRDEEIDKMIRKMKVREKDIGGKDEEIESLRREMAKREEEMREDNAREFQVIII